MASDSGTSTDPAGTRIRCDGGPPSLSAAEENGKNKPISSSVCMHFYTKQHS